MSKLAIPPAGEPIRPDWVTAVLTDADHLTKGAIEAVRAVPLHETTALVGEVWRLALDYDGETDGPQSVVVKRPTALAENRAIGQMLGLYEREQRFYKELAADSAIRVPELYFAAASDDYDQNILVIEDLAPLPVGDQIAGWSRAQAETAVDAIAKQHARWWGDPSLDGLDWLPRWGSPRLAPILDAGYGQALGPFLDRYRGRVSEATCRAAERLASQIATVADRIGAEPRTLLHGDFRADNLFFGAGGEFAAVDWQLVATGRGIFDLAYLMTQSGEPASRRDAEAGLIDRYLAALEAAGVAPKAAQALRDDYRWCILYTLIYAVLTGGSFAIPDERAQHLIDAVALRTAAAIDDHKAGDLIGA